MTFKRDFTITQIDYLIKILRTEQDKHNSENRHQAKLCKDIGLAPSSKIFKYIEKVLKSENTLKTSMNNFGNKIYHFDLKQLRGSILIQENPKFRNIKYFFKEEV